MVFFFFCLLFCQRVYSQLGRGVLGISPLLFPSLPSCWWSRFAENVAKGQLPPPLSVFSLSLPQEEVHHDALGCSQIPIYDRWCLLLTYPAYVLAHPQQRGRQLRREARKSHRGDCEAD